MAMKPQTQPQAVQYPVHGSGGGGEGGSGSQVSERAARVVNGYLNLTVDEQHEALNLITLCNSGESQRVRTEILLSLGPHRPTTCVCCGRT
jgi:hypothetical protein